jgi:hypothetical protein
VKRRFASALVLTFCWAPLQGATLERLSLDDMVEKSTSIVRAQVLGSSSRYHGQVIYTHYRVQPSEWYKGSAGALEVSVPGGQLNGVRQEVTGAPVLAEGQEYVLFLWASPAGITHILGLTQGLFSLSGTTGSDPTVSRRPSRELMLDRATGRPVRDEHVSLKLSELRSRISGGLARRNGK